MNHPTQDQGADWEKLLHSLDTHSIPPNMNKEELAAFAANRELRAALAAPDFNEETGWEAFRKAHAHRRRRPALRLWLAAAAVLILAAGAAVWLLQAPGTRNPVLAESAPRQNVELRMADGRVVEPGKVSGTIRQQSGALIHSGSQGLKYTADTRQEYCSGKDTLLVPNGLPFRVQLADGSKIWLNAGSRLIYPQVFDGPEREVLLEGEAYFDVAQRSGQPFIVRSRGVTMTVLGTTFNVNTYTSSVVTTLCTGKLRVSAAQQQMVLLPDEQLDYNPGGGFGKREVDTRDFTAWKDGDLYFDGEELEAITKSLSRYYDYEFVFAGPDMRKLRFTLDMPRPAKLQVVLDHLKSSRQDLHFRIDGRTVYIEAVHQ